MPLPLLLIIPAGLAGIIGLAKGAQAVSSTSKASNLNTEARELFESAAKKLKGQKLRTTRSLESLGANKLEIWTNQIGRFVEVFGKLKNVELTGSASNEFSLGRVAKGELAEMRRISLQASEIVGGGLASLGAGALAGFGAYGGATMLATASTGTAISTLSGVAATNATLAWFGGGALSAGGFGMAGGAAVLGGIVAGPALLIGGFVLSAKAKEKLAAAHSNYARATEAAEEMESVKTALKGIQKVTAMFSELIEELVPRVEKQVDTLARLVREKGNDYSNYTAAQRQKVHLTVEFVALLKQVLETPILSKNGSLKRGLVGSLQGFRNTQAQLEET